jgi:hypothetical protein
VAVSLLSLLSIRGKNAVKSPLTFWPLLVTIDWMAPKLSVKRRSPFATSRAYWPLSNVLPWRMELFSRVSVQLTPVYGPVTQGTVILTFLIRRK